jgi:hypothetical protein
MEEDGRHRILVPHSRRVVRLVTVILAALIYSAATYASPTSLRAHEWKTDPCLAWIVDHEDGTWNPVRYGAGDSYGIPQANPGDKMAIAGANWRTSASTQLKWMRWYVGEIYKQGVSVYQGACDAKAHWLIYHSY